ncbi:hypothetical protein ACFXTO_010477 [Malus domestica]
MDGPDPMRHGAFCNDRSCWGFEKIGVILLLGFVSLFQMDAPSHRFLEELLQSAVENHEDGGVVSEQSVQPATCALCQRAILLDNEATEDAEIMCGDCKFLYLEDLGTPSHDSYQRTPPTRRRARTSSSESLENTFLQQFSHVINLVRQNQSPGAGLEELPVDGDSAARIPQSTSNRTTPSGSRRWRRVLSDTESEGYENVDSLYGETESNLSFGRYRVFHGENDANSFSAYGGDSDASVDLHGFLDIETVIQPDEGSAYDSDTDIDPMHAGLSQWNSDDAEDDDDEGDEEDDEWEEGGVEVNIVESRETPGGPLRNLLVLSPSRSNGPSNWRQQIYSPESEGMIRYRMRGTNQVYDLFSNVEESELLPYVGNSGDYLDARGFEELLEHLAEVDSLRRGAPPASVSLVNNLPRVVISKEHDKYDDLACAICKDVLPVGTEVNQLPCSHLYHSSCILPWLSTRNTCPLCRYELPTDDRDYEEGKRNVSARAEIHNVRQQNASEDSSSGAFNRADEDEDEEHEQSAENRGPATDGSRGENGRGRWFFLAAAPIVSLVGIVLVLWLGSPLLERRRLAGNQNFANQDRHQSHVTGASPHHRENRSRPWWSLF